MAKKQNRRESGLSNSFYRIGVLRYLKKILNSIPDRQKRRFYFLLLGMILLAIIETLVLALLSIYATAISVPNELIDSQSFKKFLGLINYSGNVTIEILISTLSILVVLGVGVKNLLTYLLRAASAKYEALIQSYFGQKILEKLLNVDYEWHLNQNPNATLYTLGLKTSLASFIQSVLIMAGSITLVLVMLIGVIIIQPHIMPIMIVVVASAAYFVYKVIRRYIDENSQRMFDWSIAHSLDSTKTIHSMKDVRIFGLEERFHSNYSEKVHRFSYYFSIASVLGSVPSWIMETFGFLLLSLAVILMTLILKLSKVEVFSTLAILAVTAWKVLPAVNRIITSLSAIRSNFPFIDQIYGMLNSMNKYRKQNKLSLNENEKEELLPNISDICFSQRFELQNISFKYSNSQRYAIENVTFTVNRGESIGIIGHSGAGKSTLVDIIIGLLEPDMGDIVVDGRIVRKSHIINWRKLFGYVHQFPYIYDCTLAENIAFGEQLEDVDKEKVYSMCQKASIDFLDTLEDGIYTSIGERGLKLSGGQKQRVTIARALYRKPEILIFDEATSSLDTKSEQGIRETMENLKGDQTMIIIAHRLSTVQKCDKIVWLENGKMLDIGIPSNILPQYERYSEH